MSITSKLSPGKLRKTEGEVKKYTFDFSADMETGETISGTPVASVTPATGAPTLGTPVPSGQQVQVPVSGGTAGTYYVGCQIVTSASETLEGYFTLLITEM